MDAPGASEVLDDCQLLSHFLSQPLSRGRQPHFGVGPARFPRQDRNNSYTITYKILRTKLLKGTSNPAWAPQSDLLLLPKWSFCHISPLRFNQQNRPNEPECLIVGQSEASVEAAFRAFHSSDVARHATYSSGGKRGTYTIIGKWDIRISATAPQPRADTASARGPAPAPAPHVPPALGDLAGEEHRLVVSNTRSKVMRVGKP